MNSATTANRWEKAELEAETAAMGYAMDARRYARRGAPEVAAMYEGRSAEHAGDAGLFGAKADRTREDAA